MKSKESKKTNNDEKLIQEAVNFINVNIKTVDNASYEIGHYILDKFFDGDINNVLSKDPKKPKSLRSLLKRTDLLVSPGRLSEATRVAALQKRLQASNHDLTGVSYSHLAELIKLGPDNFDKQIELVGKIREDKLSTRALAKEVRKMKPAKDKTSQNGAQTANPVDTRTRNQWYCEKTIALFSEIPDDCNFDELYDYNFNTENVEALQDLASQMKIVLAKAITFKEKCEDLLPKLEEYINERAVTASEQFNEDPVERKAA